MSSESSIVYETAKYAIINMVSINEEGKSSTTFSGWIQDVKDGRIFVITCAHNVLKNNISEPSYPLFSGTIENANGVKNIGISLNLLGMDVSADIAVLYSIKPCEQTSNNPLGFLFNEKQIKKAPLRSLSLPISYS